MTPAHAPTATGQRRGRRLFTAVAIVLGLAMAASSCTDNVDWAGNSGADSTQGSEQTAGGYRATIRRTDDQVAHIEAADLENLAFGQGWASAEDRACDLADQVVKIRSERARWFGPGEDNANIDSDFAWLSVGIRRIAENDWKKGDKEVRSLFTAYAAGWNAQIADIGVDNIDDWCAGEPWVTELSPVDIYAYARSVALLASSGALIDMIGTAEPPKGDSSAPPADATSPAAGDDEQAMPALVSHESPLASNGWAIGSDRSADGTGMLLANPHFPWEGELRFWEVHLTVPGRINMYGVQLSGIPGIGIGFNEHFGWTHTVSAGNRFTAYTLDLVDGSPTTYRYGDTTREMTPEEFTIQVSDGNGQLHQESRTTWRSHYGPILDFPGVGWSDERAVSMRDANIDNDEFITQYVSTLKTRDLDGLIELNRRYTGVPLFNTIAVSDDGRAWYADTAATPNLSKEAQDAYLDSLRTDFLAQAAADSGAVLLDGSDPRFEWQDAEGARDPGLVPFSEMPMTERSDYVFNANDSFWLANAKSMIEGDYSILHGRQRTPRSPRTRENATVLEGSGNDDPAGSDNRFSLAELEAAALQNRGFTSRALKDAVVQRCKGAGPVDVGELVDDKAKKDEKPTVLLAARVDISEACDILESWDGRYDNESRGAIIWREFMAKYTNDDQLDAGALWAEPFDPANPVATPSGLAAAEQGATDPVLVNLARSVQALGVAGIDLDSRLGDVQFANRNGTKVPIHGGDSADGTTNVVSWSKSFTILDPMLKALRTTTIAPRTAAKKVTYGNQSGGTTEMVGYPVIFGTSFLMALEFTKKGPVADTFLSYGNLADRDDPSYVASTERFSAKEWKRAMFTESDVRRAATTARTVTG